MLILATRFAAELFAFAAAAYLGARAPLGQPWPVVLAVALPVALIAFWGLVAAPKASNSLPPRAREAIGTAVMLGVAAVLAAAGLAALGVAYGVIVVADYALVVLFDPRPAVERRLAGIRG